MFAPPALPALPAKTSSPATAPTMDAGFALKPRRRLEWVPDPVGWPPRGWMQEKARVPEQPHDLAPGVNTLSSVAGGSGPANELANRLARRSDGRANDDRSVRPTTRKAEADPVPMYKKIKKDTYTGQARSKCPPKVGLHISTLARQPPPGWYRPRGQLYRDNKPPAVHAIG